MKKSTQNKSLERSHRNDHPSNERVFSDPRLETVFSLIDVLSQVSQWPINKCVVNSIKSRFHEPQCSFNLSSRLRKTCEMKKLFEFLLFQQLMDKDQCFSKWTILSFGKIFLRWSDPSFWLFVQFIVKKNNAYFKWAIIWFMMKCYLTGIYHVKVTREKNQWLSTMYWTENSWIWKSFLEYRKIWLLRRT